jgi:hypothetical protein
MSKFFLKLIMPILLLNNIYAYNFDFIDDKNKVTTAVTTSPSSLDFSLNLDLGANLLQDLQDAVTSKIDDFFNPYIHDLKEMQRKNIETLNFSDSPAQGMINDLMSAIGMKDGTFLNNIKVCDAKNASSFCDYYGKSQYFAFSSLLPQAVIDARQTIKETHDKLTAQVKEIGQDFKNQVNSAWDKVMAEVRIDGPLNEAMADIFAGDVVTDYLMDRIAEQPFFASQSAESKAILGMINGTTSPQQAAIAYAKKTNSGMFDYENVEMEFGYNESISNNVSNNLCDLAMDMFSGNKDKQQALNAQLSKLRKELYKYATFLLMKKLTDDLELITVMQTIGKMTQCAIEASIAAAATVAEQYGLPSFVSGAAMTAISAKSNSQSGSSADGSTETDQKATNPQDCMEEISDKNKKELDIEGEIGLSNFGITFWPLTLVDLWVFSPLSNLALGVKGKINWITQYFKSDEDYEKCIARGKSEGWQKAYHECMAGNSGLEFKIKSDLEAAIAKLFEPIRKKKKKECEMLDEASQLDVFNFDKIKISFKPTVALGNWTDDGTWDYFGSFVSKLVTAGIEQPTDITNIMSIYLKDLESIHKNEDYEKAKQDGVHFMVTRHFKTIKDFINCSGIDPMTGSAYTGCQGKAENTNNKGDFFRPLPANETFAVVGFRKFCSLQVANLLTVHSFQEILDQSTASNKKDKKVPTFSAEIKRRLSNIYQCSKVLADLVDNPVEQKVVTVVNPETSTQLKGQLSYMIDKKWLVETNQISEEEFKQAGLIMEATGNRFDNMNEVEKIKICINTRKKENLKNTSYLYKLCKAYKLELFNEILKDAKISFKKINYDSKSSFAGTMKGLKSAEEDFKNKYNIE